MNSLHPEELVDSLIVWLACGGFRGSRISDVLATIDWHCGNLQSRPDTSLILSDAQTSADPNNITHADRTIWSWLVVRPDVLVGTSRQYNHVPLEELLLLPENEWPVTDQPGHETADKSVKPSPAIILEYNRELETPSFQPRIYVSEDRIWRCLSGHGLDYKRIPRFEWQALLGIASAREDGVVQSDLTRLTGQDKRSIPRRTEMLAQKGYVVKQATLVCGLKTSKLWLKRFAPSIGQSEGIATSKPTLPISSTATTTTSAPSTAVIIASNVDRNIPLASASTSLMFRRIDTSNLDPVPWHTAWTGSTIDFMALGRTIMAIAKAFGVIRYVDVKAKLGIIHLRWHMRVAARTCRFFVRRGGLQFVVATVNNRIFKDCLRYVQDLSTEDWQAFRAAPSRVLHGPSEATNANVTPSTAMLLTEGGRKASHGLAGLVRSERFLWTPEHPFTSLAIEAISSLSSLRKGLVNHEMDETDIAIGLTNHQITTMTLGPSFSRYTSAVSMALSQESSQPVHLRYLQPRSKLLRLGKIVIYRYYPPSGDTMSIDRTETYSSTPQSVSEQFGFDIKSILRDLRPLRPLQPWSVLSEGNITKTPTHPPTGSSNKRVVEEAATVVTPSTPAAKRRRFNSDSTQPTPNAEKQPMVSVASTGSIGESSTIQKSPKKIQSTLSFAVSAKSTEKGSTEPKYVCLKCGGTWKNDVGLKYHQTKSKTSCNTNYDPSLTLPQASSFPRPKTPRNKNNATVSSLGTTSTLDVSPSKSIPRTMYKNIPVAVRRARETDVFQARVSATPMPVISSLCLSLQPEIEGRLRSSTVDEGPNATLNYGGGFLSVEPCDIVQDVRHDDVLVTRVVQQTRKTLGIHQKKQVERPRRSASMSEPNPYTVDSANPDGFTSEDVFVKREEEPENTTIVVEEYPASDHSPSLLPSSFKAPPFSLSPQSLQKYEYLSEIDRQIYIAKQIIQYLVRSNRALFPARVALWRAVLGVWHFAFNYAPFLPSGDSSLYSSISPSWFNIPPPSYKVCQQAVRETMKSIPNEDHLIEVTYGFHDTATGGASRCHVIMKASLDRNGTPELEDLKQAIKAAHPRPYIPEPFASMTKASDLNVDQAPPFYSSTSTLSMSRTTASRNSTAASVSGRRQRVLSGLAVLTAPIYHSKEREAARSSTGISSLSSQIRDATTSETSVREPRFKSMARPVITASRLGAHSINRLERAISSSTPAPNDDSAASKILRVRGRVPGPLAMQHLATPSLSYIPRSTSTSNLHGDSFLDQIMGPSNLRFLESSSYLDDDRNANNEENEDGEEEDDEEEEEDEEEDEEASKRASTTTIVSIGKSHLSIEGIPSTFNVRFDVTRALTPLFQPNVPTELDPPTWSFLSTKEFEKTYSSSLVLDGWYPSRHQQWYLSVIRGKKVALGHEGPRVGDSHGMFQTIKLRVVGPPAEKARRIRNRRRSEGYGPGGTRNAGPPVRLTERVLSEIADEAVNTSHDANTPSSNVELSEMDMNEKYYAGSTDELLDAAFVSIRVLLGGTEKVIDWGRLRKLFPQYSLVDLRKFWIDLSKTRALYLRSYTERFQEAFLEAYRNFELPRLDFDNLDDYDWHFLLRWTIDIQRTTSRKLPLSRQELYRCFDVYDAPSQARVWRERYFTNTLSVFGRFEAITSVSASLPVNHGKAWQFTLPPVACEKKHSSNPEQNISRSSQSPCVAKATFSASDLVTAARLCFRSFCCIPVDRNHMEEVTTKFRELGQLSMLEKKRQDKLFSKASRIDTDGEEEEEHDLEDEKAIEKARNVLVDSVIVDLTMRKIISRGKALSTGDRGYRLNKQFQAQLERSAHASLYMEAATFKATLDTVMRRQERWPSENGDSTQARVYKIPFTLPDGACMAILNLAAHHRVVIEGEKIPDVPYGFEPGNYESRKMSKSLLLFGLNLRATEAYQVKDASSTLPDITPASYRADSSHDPHYRPYLYTRSIPTVQCAMNTPIPVDPTGHGFFPPLWCDVLGRPDAHMWFSVLGMITFLLVTRGGTMTSHSLLLDLQPMLEEIDIVGALEWGVRVGLFEALSPSSSSSRTRPASSTAVSSTHATPSDSDDSRPPLRRWQEDGLGSCSFQLSEWWWLIVASQHPSFVM